MKSEAPRLQSETWARTVSFSLGVIILGLVYIFQRFSPAEILGEFPPNVIFVINRTIRLILNDLACFLIIFALFKGKKFLKIAFIVFLAELLVILPVYLVIKLTMEGDSEISSPLLSQVHRLVVNPMLMFLLIAGFFYQQFFKK